MLHRNEQSELDLKEKSCVISRLKNKQEELKLEKITLLKENERLINKKEQAELSLKDKSCLINRLNKKEEELKLEKSILMKENERLLNKKEEVVNSYLKFKEEFTKNVQEKVEQVKELTKCSRN